MQFKKRKNDKALCQKWHCVKRFRQRVGIELDDNLYERITNGIKKSQSVVGDVSLKFLRNQTRRLGVYEVLFPNKDPVQVIYDRQRNTIVTVLESHEENVVEITKFIDLFGNIINVKHDLGYSRYWRLISGQLKIIGETIFYHEDGLFEITDGMLKGRKFKHDGEVLYEI